MPWPALVFCQCCCILRANEETSRCIWATETCSMWVKKCMKTRSLPRNLRRWEVGPYATPSGSFLLWFFFSFSLRLVLRLLWTSYPSVHQACMPPGCSRNAPSRSFMPAFFPVHHYSVFIWEIPRSIAYSFLAFSCTLLSYSEGWLIVPLYRVHMFSFACFIISRNNTL